MTDAVREALVLRHLALSLLGGVAPDPSSHEAALRCEPGAWSLFLQAEGVGLLLRSRLKAAGLLAGLPGGIRAVVEAVAAAELQRVLSARAQLPVLDRIAGELGMTPVLLKGGAHQAMGGEPMYLTDLDVVLPPEQAEGYAAALRAAGYRQQFESMVADPHAKHLPELLPPVGIPVEVHHRVRYGGDVLTLTGETHPVPGYRALQRACGPRTLANLLFHSVVTHPQRLGHLRDLVLVGAMARELSADDRAVAEARLAAAPDAREMLAMLAQAQAVDGGAPVPDPPVCRLRAARKYALIAGEDAFWYQGPAAVSRLSYLGFEPPARSLARIRGYLGGPVHRNSRWFPQRLARVWPALATGVAVAVRSVPRLLIVAGSLCLVPRALWKARRRAEWAARASSGATTPDATAFDGDDARPATLR